MSGSFSRVGAREKLTGQAVFSGDIRLEGLLVGKILYSKVPHALIKNIEVSQAKAFPGVKAVVIGKDFPDALIGFTVQDEIMMARDKIRYIGEPVAAVAAVDQETAERALGLIDVQLTELPAVLTVEDAMAATAPIIHENFHQYASHVPLVHDKNVLSHVLIKRGDVEIGFAESDVVVEDTFSTPVVYPAPMELKAAVARVDASGNVIVWCSSQAPFAIRSGLAQTLAMPMSKIRVIGATVGGAFGSKGTVSIEPITALLAIKAGRPVKIQMSREDDFSSGNPRHSMKIWVKTGAKRDGTIVCRQAKIVVDTGAYAHFGPHSTSQCATLITGPYNIPNLLIEGICVYTNKISCGPCRAPGGPQAHFAAETQIDRLAEELNVDRFEIRMKNALSAGDRTATGQVLNDHGYREVLSALKGAIGEQFRSIPSKQGWARGIGIAGCFWGMSGYGSSATVRVNEDGTVILVTGAAEIGQGSDTALALLVARELDIPVERVKVVSTDTDAAPYDFGAVGSRTTQAMGVAVVRAARAVKGQLLEMASKKLKVPQSDLSLSGGRIFAMPEKTECVSLAEASTSLTMAFGGPVVASATNLQPNPSYDSCNVQSHSVPSKPFFVFGAQAVAVDVDETTGKVDVIRVIAVHDVGKAIYLQGVEGQIRGGVAMGLGYALSEETIFKKGQPINANFADYRVPTIQDVCEISPIILEKPNAKIPDDIRGIGEPPVMPVAAAVANAIYDAVQVRLYTLPFTPERVYWAIRRKEVKDGQPTLAVD